MKILHIEVSDRVFDDLQVLATYHGNCDVNQTATFLFYRAYPMDKISDLLTIARKDYIAKQSQKGVYNGQRKKRRK